MPFTFEPLGLSGLMVVRPRMFPDGRGVFLESYKRSDFERAGITVDFVQDNHSVSSYGVLRGLHYQLPPHAQGKLVRVVEGKVWDVAVDIRRGSPTLGQWHGLELSSEELNMYYLPPGFAHGFVALSERVQIVYKCSAEYSKQDEAGIRWDDPALGIAWPLRDVNVSERDRELPLFADASLFPEDCAE